MLSDQILCMICVVGDVGAPPLTQSRDIRTSSATSYDIGWSLYKAFSIWPKALTCFLSDKEIRHWSSGKLIKEDLMVEDIDMMLLQMMLIIEKIKNVGHMASVTFKLVSLTAGCWLSCLVMFGFRRSTCYCNCSCYSMMCKDVTTSALWSSGPFIHNHYSANMVFPRPLQCC